MKECIVCQKKYEPSGHYQKCCSKGCSKIHKNENDKIYTQAKYILKEEKECIVCKKKFLGYPIKQKCCSKECSKIKTKLYKQEYYKPIAKIQKQCRICNKTFIADKSIYVYCSEECSKIGLQKYLKQYKQKDKYRNYLASDKYKQDMQTYRDGHKEEKRLYGKVYNTSDAYKVSHNKYRMSEKGKIFYKKWNQSPVAKHIQRMAKLRRKEKINNCIHSFTKEQWNQKVELTKGICPCCYERFNNNIFKLSLDHTPSLSSANKKFKLTGIKQVYTINEINPLCLRCNIIKGDKDITIDELRKIVIGKNNINKNQNI